MSGITSKLIYQKYGNLYKGQFLIHIKGKKSVSSYVKAQNNVADLVNAKSNEFIENNFIKKFSTIRIKNSSIVKTIVYTDDKNKMNQYPTKLLSYLKALDNDLYTRDYYFNLLVDQSLLDHINDLNLLKDENLYTKENLRITSASIKPVGLNTYLLFILCLIFYISSMFFLRVIACYFF